MQQPPMSVSDAIGVVRWAATDPVLDVDQLVSAGLALAGHVTETLRELECERARARGLSREERVGGTKGDVLIERTEVGGLRHFLGGRPVHAGQGLYVLTFGGWFAGRYEWTFRSGVPPCFFFSLPGVDAEVSVAIPAAARLAWPEEVEW